MASLRILVARAHCLIAYSRVPTPVVRGRRCAGKVIYQRDGMAGRFFARPFKFIDGQLHVPAGPHLEESVAAILGGDQIKLGCMA